MSDKPRATSCDRNREPILRVLHRYLYHSRSLLEIGSGTGQHAVYFAAEFPALAWQTSDLSENHAGIRAWIADSALANVLPPIELDVGSGFPDSRYDVVFTSNTLHIMSWDAVQQLFAALPGITTQGALFIAYGPFNYAGDFTSPSNREFDTWLKTRNVRSGIRDFEAVNGLAGDAGFELVEDCEMPANNRCLVWRNLRSP